MYENLKKMSEMELRDFKCPWPQTKEELDSIINALAERDQDYGTCVYSMSIAAEAAFRYIASKLGVTGFQASCADLDFFRRIRGYKFGFQVINMENLLYPQYKDELSVNPKKLLEDPRTRKVIKAEAKKLLSDKSKSSADGDVIKHWKKLAALPDLKEKQ